MKYVLMGLLLSFSLQARTVCTTDAGGFTTCTDDKGGRTTCQTNPAGFTVCD